MKHFVSSMRIAFRALQVNKLRSALTMLGIVIGVAAVIATAAIGSGAKQRIQHQIASIGSNTIIVLPGSLTSSGLRMGNGKAVTLSESDARELPAQCSDIALAVPVVRGGAQIVYENNNWATILFGTTPGFLVVRDLSIDKGVSFSQQDVDSANKVAVLGMTVVTNLFGDIDPVGQSIRIKNVPFTVEGVLDRKGQSPTGQDQDDVILLPISTAKRKVLGIKSANADAVDAVMMAAKSGNQIEAAQEETRALLRQRHHLAASEDDDFSIRNMEEIFAAQEASSHIMSIMLAAVGFGLVDRGRYWNHEHHAGLGAGTYAGNRAAPSGRSKNARYPDAISDRSRRALHRRWMYRNRSSNCSFRRHFTLGELEHGGERWSGDTSGLILSFGRNQFGILSRPQGRLPGSYRSFAF